VAVRSSVASELVIDMVHASFEAVAIHFSDVVSASAEQADIAVLAKALDYGYEFDLTDYLAEDQGARQPLGFDHGRISDVFRSRLSRYANPSAKGQAKRDAIWEADEDRGIFSLFGAPAKTHLAARQRKTRVSAITQRAMRDARNFRHAEKATTSSEASPYVTLPSPLYIAAQILGDPKNQSSQIYARSALQEWIRGELEFRRTLDVSFDAVAGALEVINNRWHTSKPIRLDSPTILFVCNLLAIHGYMAMRINLEKLSELQNSATAGKQTDLIPYLYDMLFGQDDAEFLVNPHFTELPSLAEFMNLIDGLPIGIEGAETIFQGGMRLSRDRSIVAAVSGTFGAGKTLFGLSLAAALAPLGCKTLYLSFEESAEDIEGRMKEVAPPGMERAAMFFRCNQPATDSPPSKENQKASDWFMARHLRLTGSASASSELDPAAALSAMLEDTISSADFFAPFTGAGAENLPRFARPVIIIDGMHQLFDLPHGDRVVESSLRDLVDTCRELGAIFIFSFSKEATELRRLEYLCDLIIELDREGFDDPSESPRRYFQLLKARRQPARIGSHIFHLKGQNGFRLKPSTDARLQDSKRELWWDPDPRAEIFLTQDPPHGFRDGLDDPARNMVVRNWGQILVIGKGSSGKAGFGLYLLHRRWFDHQAISAGFGRSQLNLPDTGFEEIETVPQSARARAVADAGLPVWYESPNLETRVLVISFLYQNSYYHHLTKRLNKRRGKPMRTGVQWGPIGRLEQFDFHPLPDRMRTDTIELYPGMLGPEDFIAKVEKKLAEAEAKGVPYTGVLVDGLHNVFVQFPRLEEPSSFWGMFYNILRRRRVTVVTTHTEFDVQGSLDGEHAPAAHNPFIYNFEQAQRKIAPLLSALVSGADYLFEISPRQVGNKISYAVMPRGSIGGDVGNFGFSWDKKSLILKGTLGPQLHKPAASARNINETQKAAVAALLRFIS